MMYDSILFGNGLTLSALSEISKISTLSDRQRLLCNQNQFIYEFLSSDNSEPICPNFSKIFREDWTLQSGYQNHLDALKRSLFSIITDDGKTSLDILKNKGFESWGGNIILDHYKEFAHSLEILYALNNFWYINLLNEVINLKKEKKITEIIKHYIYNLSKFSRVMTLNFDTLFDSGKKSIAHIHGKFLKHVVNFEKLCFFSFFEDEKNSIPDVQEFWTEKYKKLCLSLYYDIDVGDIDPNYGKERFEYTYLFGTNEIEKGMRLTRIKQKKGFKNRYYNMSFIGNGEINLGNLLIYGISFQTSSLVPDEFWEQYTQDEFQFFRYIDGHILRKLYIMQKNGYVNRITFACWNEEDREHYDEIIKLFHLHADVIVHKTLDYFVEQE